MDEQENTALVINESRPRFLVKSTIWETEDSIGLRCWDAYPAGCSDYWWRVAAGPCGYHLQCWHNGQLDYQDVMSRPIRKFDQHPILRSMTLSELLPLLAIVAYERCEPWIWDIPAQQNRILRRHEQWLSSCPDWILHALDK